MSEWKALMGRVTLMTPTLITPTMVAPPQSAHELYRRVWGNDPDRFQNSQNPLVPSVAQGQRGGVMVACTIAANRIDFNLAPSEPQEDGRSPHLLLIKDIKRLYADMEHVAMELGKGLVSKPVNRVAVFVQFFNIATNPQDANQKILAAIPQKYQITLTDEEAFILQLSCPRLSQDNRRINLTTKWSIDQIQVVTISASLVDPRPASNLVATPYLGASVSFDCNTAPSDVSLTSEQQGSLLLETLALTTDARRSYGLIVEDSGNDDVAAG